MKYIISIMLIIFSTQSFASESTYICVIGQVLELSDKGKLIETKGTYTSVIGKKFTIDRNHGDMIGYPFTTKSYKKITILDKGSNANAFKSISISHPPNIWAMYMYVKEFQKGKYKPFWGNEGSYIFSGNCE